MTAQAHENLVYEGEQTSMAACPPLPASHPRIVALSPKELGSRKDLPSVVGSTWNRNRFSSPAPVFSIPLGIQNDFRS